MPQNRFWILLSKKLSGEASGEELQELEDLLQKNPDWHYSLQHIQDIWNLSSKKDSYESEEAFEHHINRMKKKGIDVREIHLENEGNFTVRPSTFLQAGKRRRWIFIASSIFIAGLFFAVIYYYYNRQQTLPIARGEKPSEVSTQRGSKSKMVLPDGSLVWLNAGSTLTYNKNFGAGLREVKLIGEAYFEVATIKDQPFLIRTSEVDIKVLGTAFNVKCYPEDGTTETSLIRGSVEITIKNRPEKKFILKSKEKLVVANKDILLQTGKQVEGDKKIPMVALEQVTYTPNDSNIIETSWMDNKLIFRDESFKELALRMERWYDVTIEFKDVRLEKMRLTGIFKDETVHQALEALKITSDFHYVMDQNKIIITR